MAKIKVPETSLEAWRSLSEEQITDHHAKIVKALVELGSATAEKISTHISLNYAQVSRRMKELELRGVIEKTGDKGKTSTGRGAFLYKTSIKPPPAPEPKIYIQKDLFNN